MAARSVLVVLVAAAIGVARAPVNAESPPPTVLVPEAAVSTDAAGMYATFGFGQAYGTERLHGHAPKIAFTLGASLPIKGRAFVDVGMFFSEARSTSEPTLAGVENQAHARA